MELKYYPYVLSEQRISLLSDEEKKQYCFEHSDYCDWAAKERALQRANFRNAYQTVRQQYLNEMMNDPIYQNESEEKLGEAADAMTAYDAENIVYELAESFMPIFMEAGMTQEELEDVMNCVHEDMFGEEMALNEDTPGPDMSWFLEGLGIKATLISLFTGMGYLLLLGKTKAAISSLKKYMNKLVELIDDGINKPKGRFEKWKLGNIFAKFFKNRGDKEIACFREIQEMYEANIACKAMVLLKNIGLLSNDFNTAMEDIQKNIYHNGGYANFITNIAEPLSKLGNKI